MTAPHVWHLWHARHWPASVHEETQFLKDLRRLAASDSVRSSARPVPADPMEARRDARVGITAVLNALRCGLSVQELLNNLPGSDPRELLTAYEDLDARRAAGVAAWEALIAGATWEAVQQFGSAAAVLMPVPVHRILTITANTQGRSLAAAVRSMAATVQEHGIQARRVEVTLERRTAPDRRAIELGTRLHNPTHPGLWGSPYYLPARVTSLSAPRVADLLGERDHHA